MGTMTLEDFRQEVRLVCGGIQSGSPVWTDPIIDRRINASYLWVSMPNHYEHPELETTELVQLVAGQAAYATTNTYYEIVSVSHVLEMTASVVDTSRRQGLDPIDIQELRSLQRTARRPTHFSWWNNEIVLSCVPDATSALQPLEVKGYRQPDTLALDADTTLLRIEWDEVIIVGAEWRMWITMNEHDRAYEAKQNFGSLVNEIADPERLHASMWGWRTGPSQQTQHMRIN